MTEDELLMRFGLPPRAEDLQLIRAVVSAETERTIQEPCCGNIDTLKLGCVLLFSQHDPADALMIWRAKRASADAGFAIDVQLLCGGGVSATKEFLRGLTSSDARDMLAYIESCEVAGDFTGFTPGAFLSECIDYYND